MIESNKSAVEFALRTFDQANRIMLDVCVWGSTGVVGRLVAEHLARDYQVGSLFDDWKGVHAAPYTTQGPIIIYADIKEFSNVEMLL